MYKIISTVFKYKNCFIVSSLESFFKWQKYLLKGTMCWGLVSQIEKEAKYGTYRLWIMYIDIMIYMTNKRGLLIMNKNYFSLFSILKYKDVHRLSKLWMYTIVMR